MHHPSYYLPCFRSGVLAPREWALLSAYWTGLFNWLGNTAGDASFAYIFAIFVSAALVTGGGTALTTPQLVGLAISVLFVWSVINIFHIEKIGWVNNIGVTVQMLTIISLATVVLSMAPALNTASFIFFDYHNSTGFSQNYYVIMLSFLFPLFGFAGYDGPAHLAEETRGSSYAAPMGIVYTVVATGVFGFLLIIALMLSMQSIDDAIDGSSGNAAIQILSQTGGQNVACVFSWLLAVNIFFGGVSSITVTSRILFALCRDKATVYADTLSALNPTFRSPINAVIFLFLVQSSLLLIPLNSAGGSEAFYSILSICVVGLQISYLIPIAWKVMIYMWPAHHAKISLKLQLSPMSLGSWSFPLGVISTVWLSITTLLLLFPTTYPVTAQSMNYTCVAVGAVILFGILNWEMNSKNTFKGPPRSDDSVEVEVSLGDLSRNTEVQPLIAKGL